MWWDSGGVWIIILETIPFIKRWMEWVIWKETGLRPEQYDLIITIAMCTATRMHSKILEHRAIPQEQTSPHLLNITLPAVDKYFGTEVRAVGANAVSMRVQFLPRMKESAEIYLTTERGQGRCLRTSPVELDQELWRLLVDEAVISDETGVKREPRGLMELGIAYGRGGSMTTEVYTTDARHIVIEIFRSYVARMWASGFAAINSAGGHHRRGPTRAFQFVRPFRVADDSSQSLTSSNKTASLPRTSRSLRCGSREGGRSMGSR